MLVRRKAPPSQRELFSFAAVEGCGEETAAVFEDRFVVVIHLMVYDRYMVEDKGQFDPSMFKSLDELRAAFPEEAENFKVSEDGKSFARKTVLSVDDAEREAEEQQEFEKNTSDGFRQFSSIHDESGNMLTASKDFTRLAQAVGVNIQDAVKSELAYADIVPKTLARILVEGDEHNSGNPLQDKMVLEIGGYDGNNDCWPSVGAVRGSNYTGIDLQALHTTEKGRMFEGKLYEKLELDVMDVDRELADRQYDVMFGMGFFGFPTRSAAERSRVSPSKFELRVIEKLDHILRNGGVMFFVNRERSALDLDAIQSLGFQVDEKRLFGDQVLVLRKAGLFDTKSNEMESAASGDSPDKLKIEEPNETIQVESEDLRKLLSEFTESDEVLNIREQPELLKLEKSEKENLSMIFHGQISDAIDWYFGNAHETVGKYLNEYEKKLWREMILLGRIGRALEDGLTEKVEINSQDQNYYKEVHEKSFVVTTSAIYARSQIFHGDKPIFQGFGEDHLLFKNLEPNRYKSGEVARGTADSKSIQDLLGKVSIDGALDLLTTISIRIKNIQDYFSKKFELSLGTYSIGSRAERFLEQYPSVLTRTDLEEMHKQGNAPEITPTV